MMPGQKNIPLDTLHKVTHTSSYSNEFKYLKYQMKMVLEQNKKLASAINAISKDKEPPRSNGNQDRKPWMCCFDCRFQKTHASSNLNAHWKAKNHKSYATIEDRKGGCQVDKHMHDRKQNS